MYNAKVAIKRMRMAFMVQQQCKELSNEILVQKGVNLSRNERQGNDVGHPLLLNLVLHLDEERRKKRNKKQSKKETKEKISLFVFVFIVCSYLSSLSEEEDQETKRFHIVSKQKPC